MERTLVILKPDAVQRQMMGKIITRFEEKGLQIVACKMMTISPQLADRHYEAHTAKPFYPGLKAYMTGGPVLVLVLQADDVIAMVRKMMGATFASNAEPGTIRGDLGCAKGTFNLIHGSDSPEAAQREIGLFFGKNELFDYELTTKCWLQA